MAIATIDEALKSVNKSRADIGASMNRMEMTQKGIDIAIENTSAGESCITNSDMAKTITEHVKNQLLQSASVSLLSQANTNSQNVLSLLR
jgi:flagellin